MCSLLALDPARGPTGLSGFWGIFKVKGRFDAQSVALHIVSALLWVALDCVSVFGAEVPPELQGAAITERLGSPVSIENLRFRDETGSDVVLKDYFRPGRPVLLNLGYYGCPTLCGLVLNGLIDSLKGFEWTPGQQFELLTLSIDPKEEPRLARAKKNSSLSSYGKSGAESGWHFLTGDESQIRALTEQVGFGYRWNAQEKQWAHSAALIVLTPEGKISRYLYGIQYAPKDLKFALLEASSGKIGTVIDRILLFCYRYDPVTRKYSVVLTRVMQAGGASTVLVFGAYLALFWRRQRQERESDLHV